MARIPKPSRTAAKARAARKSTAQRKAASREKLKARARSARKDTKADEPRRVSVALAVAHGLTPQEYARIRTLIGRNPTFTELGIFSAMWNEHCSYKSS